MSLRWAATQGPICRRVQLRSSYAEISRFIRMRGHEITARSSRCSSNGTRCFASSAVRSRLEPSEVQRNALEAYKATLNVLSHDQVTDMHTNLNNSIGAKVTLSGYLATRRDVSKKLSFAILRDKQQTHCIQIVSNNDGSDEKSRVHNLLKDLKEWTPVIVKGIVKKRQPAKQPTYMGMEMINEHEIEVQQIIPLNDIPDDLVLKEETVFPPEQRHLQMRTSHDIRQALKIRAAVSAFARKKLREATFDEIETPILFKSTPEGAREFLVPTREKGLAYALPQSPQQYKQVLMASGITRYFQFARCFRDEDLRADRQPEFTQLDIEMAFVGEDAVMQEVEDLLKGMGQHPTLLPFIGGKPWIEGRVPRMTYHDAMAKYGSDKPDLRLGMEIHNITSKLPKDLIGKISDLGDPAVDAFKLELGNDPNITRKFITDFLDSPEGKPFLENPAGQPGVFVSDVSQPQQGLGALGYDFTMNMPEALNVDHGDLLILQARKDEPFYGGSTPMGNLRLALYKAAVAQGLLPAPEGFKFVWIHEFPLFTPTNDTDPGQGGTAGLSSTHHPFTAPLTTKDVDLLLTSPQSAHAAHYDIVVNGVELGGGSRRIHNAQIQEMIFRDVLQMKEERIEDFRHLLNVLGSGCPPHAGIALGWDRLVAVLLGKESVRDVIAFPKSGRGEDGLVKSPNRPTREQWETYHLQLRD